MAVCAPWATVEEVQADPECGKCADTDPEILEQALEAASDTLNDLVYGDFPGICSETVRLCPQATGAAPGWWWHGAIVPTTSQVDHNSFWRGWGCGCGGRPGCSCSAPHEIDLGRNMIRTLTAVELDGEDLLSVSTVNDYRYMARVDGGTWPCCGDLEVSYTWGSAPTPGLKRSAMLLGCQLALAWCGQQCDLPSNMTSVTRQGVSIQMFNPGDLVDMTGISVIDGPVNAYRFKRNHRGGGFSSPHRGPVRRLQTWP